MGGKTACENVYSAGYVADGASIVTVGSKHIKFWSFATDHRLREVRPDIGTMGKLQTNLCCTPLGGGAVATGTKDGEVYVWHDGRLTDVIPGCHDGGVYQITTCDYFKECVVTAGSAGVVKVFELATGQCIKELPFVKETATPGRGSLTAAALCCFQNKCLVGTEGNELFETTLDSDSEGRNAVKVLAQCHDDT